MYIYILFHLYIIDRLISSVMITFDKLHNNIYHLIDFNRVSPSDAEDSWDPLAMKKQPKKPPDGFTAESKTEDPSCGWLKQS